MKVNPTKLLVVVFVILFVGLSYVAFRYYVIPMYPEKPYFPDYQLVEGGVRWSLRPFQPFYLYSYSNRDGIPFVKVLYRNGKGRLLFGDVQLGQKIEGKIFYPMVQTGENEWSELTGVKQMGQMFGFGKRVRIMYLANSTRTGEEKYADVIEPNEPGAREFCSEFLYFCEAAKTTYLHQVDYWNMGQHKQLPSGHNIVGMEVSDLLVKGEEDYEF